MMILDELDGKILQSLSRNCRVSYNSLGNEIGMTAKSVKVRVKKMQSTGVIHSFVVKVNPLVLGYSKVCILVLRILRTLFSFTLLCSVSKT